MRGFGGSGRPVSQYERGFVAGVLTSLLFIAGILSIQSAMNNQVIESVVTYVGTFQLVFGLLEIVVIVLLIVTFVVMNTLFGGARQ